MTLVVVFIVIIVQLMGPGNLDGLTRGLGEKVLLEFALPDHDNDHIPELTVTLGVVTAVFVVLTPLLHPWLVLWMSLVGHLGTRFSFSSFHRMLAP